MSRIKIRHLVAKPQRGGHVLYYWQPAQPLRLAGFLTRRLAERTNNLADAIVEAEAFNAEVDAWRAGHQSSPVQPDTIPWLVKLYRTDPRYTELADRTQHSYEQCIRIIEAWSERAGHPPLASIERKHVRAFYRSMQPTPAQAAGVIRVLRLLLNFAVDEGLLQQNPAQKQRLAAQKPRQAVWEPEDVDRFAKAARDLGRPSMALAVLLGANLGQREGDVLVLAWSQFDGTSIHVWQRKTGRLVSVPVTTELRQALAAAPREAPNVLISETTGRPYKEDHFRHEFARIRKVAGIGALWFMDLRRTAVVRLAEAGCSVPEIAAITGHELQRTVTILETYLPRTTIMARNAIAKLEEYKRRPKLEG